MDVKHAGLVIIACCILDDFFCLNHDIRCTGLTEMQDSHPNLNANIRVPTIITFE